MVKKEFGKYYLGLDIGTDSVGWAVTDLDYNICRFNGKAMWGVHLFNEGESAETRRMARTARRRLERRNKRIALLRDLFKDEIDKIDPAFFLRLDESNLHEEDRTTKQLNSIFNDHGFTDKDYHKKFKTIYHLRSYLMKTDEKPDVRLIYLALAHIMKHRGHFLYEGLSDKEIPDFADIFNSLQDRLCELGIFQDTVNESVGAIGEVIRSKDGITSKKEKLGALIPENPDNPDARKAFVTALAGGKFNLTDLFGAEYKDAVKDTEYSKSIAISDPRLDDDADVLEDIFGVDRADTLIMLRSVYNWSILSSIMGEVKYISDAKIRDFDQHKRDLALLKLVLKGLGDSGLRERIMESKDEPSYARYTRQKSVNNTGTVSQAEFCKHLRSLLLNDKSGLWEKIGTLGIKADLIEDMRVRISNDSFMPLQYWSANSILPNTLHTSEAKKIVENMGRFYSFLGQKIDGISTGDKIVQLASFRMPYFVGPLGQNAQGKSGWAVRKENGPVTPWNLKDKVDLDRTAEHFIDSLVSYCTYLPMETVLPKNSITYGRFKLYNELNTITVNGERISVENRKRLVEDLFAKKSANITKKRLESALQSYTGCECSVAGIDDTVKSNLASEIKMREILGESYSLKLAEDLIRTITIFGDSRSRLSIKLKQDHANLSDAIINKLINLRFRDWGNLSDRFLTGVRAQVDGREMCILTAMEETNNNLNELLSSKYAFTKKIESIRKSEGTQVSAESILANMRASPAVRHAVGRVSAVIDDILKVTGHVPEKIFVETTRSDEEHKRTVSRKNTLMEKYKRITENEDSKQLLAQLNSSDDARLRRKKLFAYYSQLGCCMYCGKKIDLHELDNKEQYDMDHIYPRSQIKDDSTTNMVLTCRMCNDSKKDRYPIDESVQRKMSAHWDLLFKKDLISAEKLARLLRTSPLNVEEKAGFINRQLVETGQSVKAVAEILKYKFGQDSDIVYVKGGNVSEFRQHQSEAKPYYIKCRNTNDFHHAKDAYLNIVVGNVYDTKFTKNFATIINGDYNLRKIFEFPVEYGGVKAWVPGENGSIAIVDKMMRRDNILYSRAPYVSTGPLFDLNIKPKGLGQAEIKQGLDKEKYGAYNSVKTSYFALFEHMDKKSLARSLIPVTALVKHDPDRETLEKYAADYGLEQPKLLIPKIKIDSTISKDGLRLTLKGIHDATRLSMTPAENLIVPFELNRLFKAVFKYTDKKNLNNHVHKDSAAECKVTDEDSVKAYDFLVDKIQNGYISSVVAKPAIDVLAQSREKFIGMTLDERSELIAQILKGIHCNPEIGSLKAIGGVQIGRIFPPIKISSWNSALLINQSPSGLFENIVDLKRI